MLEPEAIGEELYRAFDWRVVRTVGGQALEGAVGRTRAQSRARERLVEALDELPDGVSGHGELVLTSVVDPQMRHVIGLVHRDRDGTVRWSIP